MNKKRFHLPQSSSAKVGQVQNCFSWFVNKLFAYHYSISSHLVLGKRVSMSVTSNTKPVLDKLVQGRINCPKLTIS